MRKVALAALALAACTPAVPPRVDQGSVQQSLTLAARQVQRCYRTPRISTPGRQIVTRLRVRLAADGTLAQMPFVLYQFGVAPGREADARAMAEAAIRAVMRCTPITLSPPLPDRERVFDLTFAPLARG